MLTDNNQIFRNCFVIIYCHLTKVSSQINKCIIFEPNELSLTLSTQWSDSTIRCPGFKPWRGLCRMPLVSWPLQSRREFDLYLITEIRTHTTDFTVVSTSSKRYEHPHSLRMVNTLENELSNCLMSSIWGSKTKTRSNACKQIVYFIVICLYFIWSQTL